MEYNIHDNMTQGEADYVERKLVEFADQFTEPRNYREFGVILRDDKGNAVGGITGNTVWDWLQINDLWIPDDLRGQGFGPQLLERAEELGRAWGCRIARLNTFEFDKGLFPLEDSGPSKGTIDLSGIKPGPNGRLIFQGKGIDATVLMFADNNARRRAADWST